MGAPGGQRDGGCARKRESWSPNFLSFFMLASCSSLICADSPSHTCMHVHMAYMCIQVYERSTCPMNPYPYPYPYPSNLPNRTCGRRAL